MADENPENTSPEHDSRPSSRDTGKLNQTLRLSPALAEVVGKEYATRAECIEAIWDYIKANMLQDPEDKEYFIPDEKLQPVNEAATIKQQRR